MHCLKTWHICFFVPRLFWEPFSWSLRPPICPSFLASSRKHVIYGHTWAGKGNSIRNHARYDRGNAESFSKHAIHGYTWAGKRRRTRNHAPSVLSKAGSCSRNDLNACLWAGKPRLLINYAAYGRGKGPVPVGTSYEMYGVNEKHYEAWWSVGKQSIAK